MNIDLIYLCVQVAAVVLVLAWMIMGGKDTGGSILRGLAVLASIASIVFLYVCRFNSIREVPLPFWIYLGVSGLVFLIYGIDKAIAASGKNGSRIPENVLLFFAVFGILGAVTGMLVWNHKRKKSKFQTCIPIIAFAECAILYFVLLRGKTITFPKLADLAELHYIPIATIVTSLILCLILVRTFIFFRLLVIIPVSLLTALFSVGLFCKLEPSVSVTSMVEIIKAKPIPFIAVAVVVFLILEVLSVKSRFFTSGNEVRKKTDHSKDK